MVPRLLIGNCYKNLGRVNFWKNWAQIGHFQPYLGQSMEIMKFCALLGGRSLPSQGRLIFDKKLTFVIERVYQNIKLNA